MVLPGFARVFLALNIVRALSIIALLLVFATSIMVLVDDVEAVNAFTSGNFNTTAFDAGNSNYIPHSTVPNETGGAFWAVLNRIFIVFQTVVLILSEVGWPGAFFDRFFPVLGKDFGVGALGVMQCLIGASVLSHYVGKFPLVTAFFLFSVGCLNIFVGLIFREGAKDKRSILSWRERGKDILPSASEASNASSRSGMGFGRQAEKAAALRGFVLAKPDESLSKYGV